MLPFKPLLLSLAVSGLGFATNAGSPVSAHEGATGIVKQRMDSMERMSKASTAMAAALKAHQSGPDELLVEHAATIHRESQQTLELYPPGSLQPVSEALPAIWENWHRFEQHANELETDSAALLAAAQAGDARGLRARLKAVGRTCKRCHEAFRSEKRH